MCVRTLVVAGVAALVCSASTPMMRADDVEPRSRLIAGRALATNYSLSLVDYQAVCGRSAKEIRAELENGPAWQHRKDRDDGRRQGRGDSHDEGAGAGSVRPAHGRAAPQRDGALSVRTLG